MATQTKLIYSAPILILHYLLLKQKKQTNKQTNKQIYCYVKSQIVSKQMELYGFVDENE